MRLPPKLWHLLHSRTFRRFLIASPVLLITAIATFYGAVNAWGESKLKNVRQQLRDQGQPTTLKELLARNPPQDVDFHQSPPTSTHP